MVQRRNDMRTKFYEPISSYLDECAGLIHLDMGVAEYQTLYDNVAPIFSIGVKYYTNEDHYK